jgi:hypothetical protein
LNAVSIAVRTSLSSLNAAANSFNVSRVSGAPSTKSATAFLIDPAPSPWITSNLA